MKRITIAAVTAIMLILPGCASTTNSSQNPYATAIIAANTVRNAQGLTRNGVNAELNQQLKNWVRNFNRSQGSY
jgi:hypothetical protein